MCISCWLPKATNTHSEHVIIISFPLQQWLHERASLLRYMYIASVGISIMQSSVWCRINYLRAIIGSVIVVTIWFIRGLFEVAHWFLAEAQLASPCDAHTSVVNKEQACNGM